MIIQENVIKSNNLSPVETKIYNVLNGNAILNRAEFVEKLRMPRTTIFDNLKKLKGKGIVEKQKRYTGERGRPREYWYLC